MAKSTDSNLNTINGYQTKEITSLKIDTSSTNFEDFIEVLNNVSPELGGVTNLGVFCDITSIEQTSAILSNVEEQFIHVDTERGEQPYANLRNDGGSIEPYDFSFEELLNN